SLYGDGQGVFASFDGDTVSWKGIGTGKLGAGGAVSYRGALIYNTTSAKLARLNGGAGGFEFEVDASGNTTSKGWEWREEVGLAGRGRLLPRPPKPRFCGDAGPADLAAINGCGLSCDKGASESTHTSQTCQCSRTCPLSLKQRQDPDENLRRASTALAGLP